MIELNQIVFQELKSKDDLYVKDLKKAVSTFYEFPSKLFFLSFEFLLLNLNFIQCECLYMYNNTQMILDILCTVCECFPLTCRLKMWI